MSTRGVAAVLALAVALAVATGAGGCATPRPDWTTGTAPEVPTAVTSTVTPSPRPAASLLTSVDGAPVMTVSQLLEARTTGTAKGGPLALRGYWSMPDIGFSCPAPMSEPGELEMYCGEWTFGITELDEMALEVKRSANEMSAGPPSGPVLVPFVPEDLYQRLILASVGGQPHAPVPIVVTGHFDDPLAAHCQPEARQACLDRFVVDTIVVFDVASVGAPTPTPSPSPFPFDSPPLAPFTGAQCRANPSDPVPVFSFVGWMPGEQVPSGSHIDYSGTTLYVAITLWAVPLGEWSDTNPRWRPMGRLVCIGREGEPGGMGFDNVPGSTYRQLEDGSTAPPLP